MATFTRREDGGEEKGEKDKDWLRNEEVEKRG